MRFKIILIALFVQIPIIIAAQQSGVAVEESPFSARVNPALMGTGNSSGVAWSGEFDESSMDDTFSFILSGQSLAYYYDSIEGNVSHNFALSFPAGSGVCGGTSLFFPEDNDEDISWNISTLIRPFNFLSLGIRTMDITGDDRYLVYGAGMRPFFFSPYWLSRITLYSDFEYRVENEITSGGIYLEPVNGLRLYSEYRFDKEIFEAGLSMSVNYFTAGIKGLTDRDYNPEKWRAFAYMPLKRERSVVKSPFSYIAEYDMGNVVRDYPSDSGFSGFVPGLRKNYSKSLYDFIRDMENIAETDEIKAVIFKNQHFLTSYANITEISDALINLRKNGKKIYFYFDNAGNTSYTLAASAADEIFLNPAGTVNLRGFSSRSVYMKDFFSKFGVEFYNFRSHDSKTAFNRFSESEMTEAERSVLEQLYKRYSEKQISMISAGRGRRLNKDIASVIASGPYLASSEAERTGLVDRRMYKDELEDFYRDKGYTHIRYSSIPKSKNYDWESMSSKILPVIYASGDIVPGNGIKGKMIGSESFSAAVRAARNNPKTECIVIRINSGGGSSFASDIIAREIALCRNSDNPKPVIVSMGGAAASGGYYMAAPADLIFTDDVTVTGSIGVIALFPDLSGLLEKLGIRYESVNSAENSDFANPLRSLSDDEISKIRNYISETYNQFVDIVKKYRELTDEEADSAAQGRVWSGADALELRLADRRGGLADAVSYAEEKYYKGAEYRIVETVPGSRIFDFPFFLSGMKEKSTDNNLLLTEELEEVLEFYKRIEQFERGEALYLFPYTEREAGITE